MEQSSATAHPDIAAEWDHDKNGPRTREGVAPTSRDLYWWKCPKQHPYEQRVERRTPGGGCPYCARRKVLPGETDVASEHPLITADRNWGSFSRYRIA